MAVDGGRIAARTVWVRGRRARRSAAVVALVGLVLALAWPGSAWAHAFVGESNPPANAVLPTAPTEVELRFTEPLEQSYSRIQLFDATGNELAGTNLRFGSDGYTMVLSLPAGLANGTYALLWRTLSTADGHTAQGYVPFTVGTERDVAAVVPPATEQVAAGAPDLVRAASRWLALLALAAVVAVWPVWLLVLRPAISPAWQAGPPLARRARRFAVVAVVAALVADAIALAVQALAILSGGGYLGALWTTLTQTRYGTLWLIRVGLLLVFAAALLGVGWWWPKRRPVMAAAALVLAALLPLPFSLLAHAAAQPAGRATAIAFDLVHLLGAAVWVGGLFVLVATLVPTLRDLTPHGRQVVLGRALPRFSLLALVAWGTMALTGVYAALLQVGNLSALTGTPYGQTLLVKLALIVPLLGLGAFNLLVVTRKIRRATDEAASTGWSARFVTAVAAETVVVTLLLGVVSMLIGTPPARDALAQKAGRLVVPLVANGEEGVLSIVPGAVGPNRYRLELGSGHAAHLGSPLGSEAVLRFSLPDQDTGQREVQLRPTADGAYEGQGSELAIAGDWTIEAKVTGPGQPDWDVTATRAIGTEPPTADLPPPPPRFGATGIAALLLMVGGIAGLVWAVLNPAVPMRREAAGLGAAAVVLAAVLLLQARLPATAVAATGAAAIPRPDPAAVVGGQPLFAVNCVACRGPGGNGDGAAAGSNGMRPTDLTTGDAVPHSDDQLAAGIRDGIAGTRMPGFGDRLSDDQIRDIVAFVRDLQTDALAAAEAPGAEACLIEPRTLDEPSALAGSATTVTGAAPLAEPSPAAGGEPVPEAELAVVRATVVEFVACSNAGDAMRRLALYSDERLRRAYPRGPTVALAGMAGRPVPVQTGEPVALLGMIEARKLADGRIAARVTIVNPQSHTHDPGTSGANPRLDAATLVFVSERGR